MLELENRDKLGVIDNGVLSELDRFSSGVAVGVDDLKSVVEDECLGDRIVHVLGLNDGESIVGVGLVLGLDEDRVSLGDGNGEQAKFAFVDVVRGDFNTIGFDQKDIVLVPVDVEH